MSALYLRLKKRKVFKICQGRIHEKLKNQFRDTQRMPCMLDYTRKPLFPQLEQKTFLNQNSDFFLSENVAWCQKK